VNGRVNDRREAVVEVGVYGSLQQATLSCVIDTGYTGTLVLPQRVAGDLGLTYAGSVRARLADGSLVVLPRYKAEISWAGEARTVLAAAVSADVTLVGTALLDGHRLTIDYGAGSVEVM
jgi:clan AA aspartic protease